MKNWRDLLRKIKCINVYLNDVLVHLNEKLGEPVHQCDK